MKMVRVAFLICAVLVAFSGSAAVLLIDGKYPVGGTLKVPPGYTCPQVEIKWVEGSRAAHDWRDIGGNDYMTAIKDQGLCGACWAFGCAAAFEAQVNILNNNPDLDWDLSERFEAACYSTVFNSPDCIDGWFIEYALEHMADLDPNGWNTGEPGICTEICYPYGDMIAGTNPAYCGDTACPEYLLERVYLAGIAQLWPLNNPPTNADEVLKNYISTHGPVVVNMSLKETHPTEPDWQDFAGFWGAGLATDIWVGPDGCEPTTECFGHCVVLVGYDDALPDPYWIARNSWGETHDGSGYFHMAMGYNNSDIYYHPMIVYAQPAVDVPTTSPEGVVFLILSFSAILGIRSVIRSFR